ncbi:conserved hypothetical protein [Trichinella spiralis]|uniref:hypothetical protein n=1 Tax=Trichinella spiralis TaxID=6334 RepID=UPI0001EFE445|nr:conserved hypothetical protein [Trichinella spiralis]
MVDTIATPPLTYQRYTCPKPLQHLFTVVYTFTTFPPHNHSAIHAFSPPPPPIQNCEPEPQSLEQSFGLVCPPAPVHHASVVVYQLSTHSTVFQSGLRLTSSSNNHSHWCTFLPLHSPFSRSGAPDPHPSSTNAE